MDTSATFSAGLDNALVDWLESHRIDYEVHRHSLAFTASDTARAEGVNPRSFAKVVGVRTELARDALLVLLATDHVDLRKAGRALDAVTVRLLTETELAAHAPECEAGAIPAVGSLFGLPTYADYAIRDDPEISFNAGSHRLSVRVDRAAWERAAEVRYVDLAKRDDEHPAWGET